MKKRLDQFSYNIFSQWGEDGMIEELLKRLNLTKGVCLEFGAWDGLLLSNTANLWTNGWKGILIESSEERMSELRQNIASFDCIGIHAHVTHSGENSLEQILERNNISSKSIDLLSIDIDGDELHIINSCKNLKPSIIIAEYNPTFPLHIEYIPPHNNFIGCSYTSLVNTMSTEYILVGATHTNALFIHRRHKDVIGDLESDLAILFPGTGVTYCISDYAGNYGFIGKPSFGLQKPISETYTNKVIQRITVSNFTTNLNKLKFHIKEIIKIFIPKKIRKGIRNIFSYYLWLFKKRNKKDIPAHMRHKRLMMRKLKKKYNTDIFIETGTAGGGTSDAMSRYFSKVYTIEIFKILFLNAKKRFSQSKNVFPFQGNSSDVLPTILAEVHERSLFWLDAHYSGDGTGMTDIETPIIKEIEIVMKHRNDHVIMIDDARCFDGTNDYPTQEMFLNYITSTYKTHSVHISNDIIYVLPRQFQ